MDESNTNSILITDGGDELVVGGSSGIRSVPCPLTSPFQGGTTTTIAAAAAAVAETNTSPAQVDRSSSCDRMIHPPDPLLNRSFDLPPRFHRRRPHKFATTMDSTDGNRPTSRSSHHRYPENSTTTTSASKKYKDTSEEEATHHHHHHHPSLTQSALNGTFGLLRHVGGVTLATTGALVAPPLNVTRRVLLPQLRAIAIDFWESNSPQRLKDWFRIVQSSIYHIVYTLRDTSVGHNLRNQWLLVWQDLIDIASTDLTRQWLIDAMGTIVKVAEALDTDEASAVLDQTAITITRALEILSNPRCRLFIHDCRHALASCVTLLADPVATTALAEVTAYLCYALEKEQTPHVENQKRRHLYQASINERDTIGKHPTMTVEEAILSSLDSKPIMNHEDRSEELQDEVPWDTASSIRNQVEQDAADSSFDWCEKARRNVDVQYLREMIEERNMDKHSSKTMLRDLVTDNPSASATTSAQRRRRRVEVVTVTEDDATEHNVVTFTTNEDPPVRPSDDDGNKVRLDGESPIDQFERILNEILKERRRQLTPILHPCTETAGASVPIPYRTSAKATMPKSRGKLLICLGMMVVLGIGTVWFGFGCLGVYLYWKHRQSHTSMVTPSIATNHEIVVRLVREVVHVDTNGKVLGRGLQKTPPSEISTEEYGKVAACVAEAYKV